MTLCECGCGEEVNIGKRFIAGHQNRCRIQSMTARINMSESHIGVSLSAEHKSAIRDGGLREKIPLEENVVVEYSEQVKSNKTHSQYLGCYVAEDVASKIFNDVRMMPPNNHGFDMLCNRDKKIDVKASVFRNTNNWVFKINWNKIADHFLCIAFDNRIDLNPVHVWLIPGGIVNHLSKIGISIGTLEKWAQYEIPIEIVYEACNEKRNSKTLNTMIGD